MIETIHKGQILELEIIDLAFGGKGIAKVQIQPSTEEEPSVPLKNFIIFIDGALPGQTVKAKISLKKRRHAEAKLIEVLEKSPDELENNYQAIPGAPWAKLPVELQQKYKKTQVFELFKKFAGVELESVFDEYVSSPEPWEYRNKMEYSFGFTSETETTPAPVSEEVVPEETPLKRTWLHEGFGLGSKRRGQYWLVDSLEKPSGIFDVKFETHLKDIRDWAEKTRLPIYSTKNQTGFWRQLLVRKSFEEDKFLVCIVTSPLELFEKTENLKLEFRNLCVDLFGEERLAGVAWQETDILSDDPKRYLSRDWLHGEDKICEVVNGLHFEISLDSFFQTNVKSAERLYDKALSYLNPQGPVLDLFSGTGTITQLIAQKYPDTKVLGVEIVASAVEDAQKNSLKNEITNVEFTCADVGKFLKENESIAPETSVILDPPRAGIVPKALKKLLEFEPRELIYISCNPATQARDTASIIEAGYKLEKFSLVDQFPHTAHVESVARFVKA